WPLLLIALLLAFDLTCALEDQAKVRQFGYHQLPRRFHLKGVELSIGIQLQKPIQSKASTTTNARSHTSPTIVKPTQFTLVADGPHKKTTPVQGHPFNSVAALKPPKKLTIVPAARNATSKSNDMIPKMKQSKRATTRQ